MNEDVLLEEVLALAEQDGYEPAYDFLLAQRGAWKDGHINLCERKKFCRGKVFNLLRIQIRRDG